MTQQMIFFSQRGFNTKLKIVFHGGFGEQCPASKRYFVAFFLYAFNYFKFIDMKIYVYVINPGKTDPLPLPFLAGTHVTEHENNLSQFHNTISFSKLLINVNF